MARLWVLHITRTVDNPPHMCLLTSKVVCSNLLTSCHRRRRNARAAAPIKPDPRPLPVPTRVRQDAPNAAVVIAPPIGAVRATASAGKVPPTVVLWLLLDPLHVDSKQTTVASGPDAARLVKRLYKWNPAL